MQSLQSPSSCDKQEVFDFQKRTKQLKDADNIQVLNDNENSFSERKFDNFEAKSDLWFMLL